MKNQNQNHLLSLLGVRHNGSLLEFPNEDAFCLALEKMNGIIEDDLMYRSIIEDNVVYRQDFLTIRDDVLRSSYGLTISDDILRTPTVEGKSAFSGFWSMNHELALLEQKRIEAWKAGKLKESEKSEPVLAQFPAGAALRALLNAKGQVKVDGRTIEFAADGGVKVFDAKGKEVAPPEGSGGPKSLCCLRFHSKTEIHAQNATDRLIGRQQLSQFWPFSFRFYFTAESVYQRLIIHPMLGNLWLNCNAPTVGLVMMGGWRKECSDASPITAIPAQTQMMNNYYRASVAHLTGPMPSTARVSRFSSIHGAPPVPGFTMYAC